jgi:hypothetical protein
MYKDLCLAFGNIEFLVTQLLAVTIQVIEKVGEKTQCQTIWKSQGRQERVVGNELSELMRLQEQAVRSFTFFFPGAGI